MAPLPDEVPILSSENKTCIQQILRSFLFYAHTVDLTILLVLNAIAFQRKSPTKKIAGAVIQLLKYVATHPKAMLQFHASDMVLHIHSNVPYLSAPKARSRASSHFFPSTKPATTEKLEETKVSLNGAVHSICELICSVIVSAAKTKVGALYANAQKGKELCTALQEMGICQSPLLNC
eukprot:15356992-Ditylum_brightwellii.AAC.2